MTTEPGQVDINWFWPTHNHIIDYSNTDCTTGAIKVNPESVNAGRFAAETSTVCIWRHILLEITTVHHVTMLVQSASHQAKVVWMNRLQKDVKEMAFKYCHGYTTFNKACSVLLVYLHISIVSKMRKTVVRYHVKLAIRCNLKTVFKMKFWIWLLNNWNKCKVSIYHFYGNGTF